MHRIPVLALLVLVAAPVVAQESPDSIGAAPQEALLAVPSDLARVEEARSRGCVTVFAAMAALDSDLGPLARRAQRIQALGQAITLEDSTEVAPFDTADALERTVRDWFVSDARMGQAYAESQDSALLAERRQARESMLQQLRDTVAAIGERGQGRVAQAGDLQTGSAMCEGKILVRPAVLEVCDTVESPVCGPARTDTASGAFRFVDDPADLWDVEQLTPWSEPRALGIGPEGALVGGRTAASVRRGNLRVQAGVGYILRARSELTPEQVAEFEENLDTMGIPFEHPELVMAPALEVVIDVPAPLDGETHYFLHFGDLSDPASQVVWTVSAVRGGPIRGSIPAAPGALARLQAGQGLSLTAVTVAPDAEVEATTEAEARYTISLTPVAQAPAVSRVLSYMASGAFSRDLLRLVPPSGGG